MFFIRLARFITRLPITDIFPGQAMMKRDHASRLFDFHQVPAEDDWPFEILPNVLRPDLVLIVGSVGRNEVGEHQRLDAGFGGDLAHLGYRRVGIYDVILEPHVSW